MEGFFRYLNENYIIALPVLGFLLGVIVAALLYQSLIKHWSERQLYKRTSQFVGLASHYLLTPISIIQTAITHLMDDDANLSMEDRFRSYEAISLGQQRLWIMAEQMVLVNDIDAGEIKMGLGVGNLSNTISDSIASTDIFARNKKVKVHFVDYVDQIKETRYDPRLLKQAIIALIDNAIKFSMEQGEVTVKLWMEGSIFRIAVEDGGIGMPKEILEHVTERFYRGGQLYSFDYEGIGLGLHIAMAIARLHQGNLTVTSKEKKGTVAILEFPIL